MPTLTELTAMSDADKAAFQQVIQEAGGDAEARDLAGAIYSKLLGGGAQSNAEKLGLQRAVFDAARGTAPSAFGVLTSATSLARWKKAVSRMRSAEGYRPLLAMGGDSKTAGVATGFGADLGQFRYVSSLPNQLAKVLSARGLPAIAESMWGDAGTSQVPASLYDPRRSGFSGWSQYGGNGGDGGIGGTMATTTTTNPGTFTPSIPVDRVIVFYKQGENFVATATASVTVDGGASLATLNGGSTPGYTRSPAINLGTLASHAISVTPAGGAPFYLAGMIAWDSTKPSIDIANLGVSGVKASWQATNARLNWINTSTVPGALRPDLTVINIGSNDMIASGPTDITAFTASVQAVITRAKLSGDVILVFPAIGRDAGSASQAVLVTDEQRAPFRDALVSLAVLSDCVFVDEQMLFGGRDAAQTAGVFADGLHENYWSTITRANNLATLLLA